MILWVLHGYTHRNQKWSVVTDDTVDEYDAMKLFNAYRKDSWYDTYITYMKGDSCWRAEDEIDNVYLLFGYLIEESEVIDLTIE